MKMGNVSSVSPGLITDVLAILESVSNVKTAKESIHQVQEQLKEYYELVAKNSVIASDNEKALKEISEKLEKDEKALSVIKSESEKIDEKQKKLKEESEKIAKEKVALELEMTRIQTTNAQSLSAIQAVEASASEKLKLAIQKEERADALVAEYTSKLEKLKSIMGDK